MSVVVDFKEFGAPTQVLFGLADSAGLEPWVSDAAEAAALAAIDALPWGPRPETTEPAIQAFGASLRAKLSAAAPLQERLLQTFANGIPGVAAPQPLYFRTGREPSVEAVPFEALWDDAQVRGFACLNGLWPIARIPTDIVAPVGPFLMERAVRIAAVVGAEGVDPVAQVTALLAGCTPPAGLSVELRVFTTTAEAAALVNDRGQPGWSAEIMPATSDALIAAVKGFQPHLLHLSCHGTADGPRLLVAQLDDMAVLTLSAEHFKALAQPAFLAPWLVTLNCCEGAAPGEQTASLTSSLVRVGLPAVIGMRKAVDAAMSDAFCANLYAAVMARVAAIAPLGRGGAMFDWATVLHEPRRRLITDFGAPEVVAGRQKEWTMPILYVASPNLRLRGRPTASSEELTDAALKAEVFTVGMADSLESVANLTRERADAMREPALARLFA